jgi:hypothetical protein
MVLRAYQSSYGLKGLMSPWEFSMEEHSDESFVKRRFKRQKHGKLSCTDQQLIGMSVVQNF